MQINSAKELKVYEAAHDLAMKIFDVSKHFLTRRALRAHDANSKIISFHLPESAGSRLRPVEAMFYVYAIESLVNSRIYIGQTQNVDRRIAAHNSGVVKSTRQDRPWRLIKSDPCQTRNAARWLEYCIKTSRGRRVRWLKD